MCTVTFISGKDRCFITSNRDERTARKAALAPAHYTVNGNILAYPKDMDAGGTWITMTGNAGAAVLLNGAFGKHVPSPPYQRSRGLVFTEIHSSNKPVIFFKEMELARIEPFTMIILENNRLHECRWDGSRKHCSPLSSCKSHIWSSTTLYDEATIQKREQWFEQWLHKNMEPTTENIMRFHHFAGDGDTGNDLCMNRDNTILTVSITSMEVGRDMGRMLYHDLKSNTRHTLELAFTPAITAL